MYLRSSCLPVKFNFDLNLRHLRSTRTSATTGYDENQVGTTTRVTRAKAAALEPGKQQTSTALASKLAPVNTRKRSALGDVSNVHKEASNGDDAKGKAGVKVAKTALATHVKSRTRDEPTTGLQSKRATTNTITTTTTTAASRRRRAPLKSLSASQVEQRARARPHATSVIDEAAEPEELDSEAEKENGSPNSSAQKTTIASSTTDEQEFVEAREALAPTEVVECDWDDLDAEEMDDPTMVAEYVNEIFDYMSELEVRTMPNAHYMDEQTDLQWKMRDILIDWLVEVHVKFRLLPETLFLAVNIVDRFLSLRIVSLDKLQLVGITGMFIAAKYEEVFSPSISNFVYVADSGYTEEEILRAETFILQVLNYDLSYPNPMNFLRRNSKADNYDMQTRTVAKYLMEIGLLDHRFLKFLPSHTAATAMYLARMMLDRPPWDRNLVHYSGGYTEEKILPVCHLMIDYLSKPVRHDAFFKKYAGKRFLKASILARQWAKRFVETNQLPSDTWLSSTANEGEAENGNKEEDGAEEEGTTTEK
ncbi:cyclin domain-containing protein [Myxozyma melibiosi]|uniref:Cyclin domain-containing protein n=1 Tax=Myxozyma melibiosi TaxID=54550 RepID=A0ABR1EZ52_9ASCO